MYCEMCFKENLKNPRIDFIGNVFCSIECEQEHKTKNKRGEQ